MHVSVYSIVTLLTLFSIKQVYCYFPLFDLYTRTNPNSLFRVDENNIKSSPYSSTRKSYLIIHGWNGGSTNDWVLKIKDNLLAKENANVFAVDWSEGSSGVYYPNQASSVSTCGTRVASFLLKAAIPLSTVHCIGHSLGAHVCGFTGKKGKLARISGMDPAGPGFKGKTAAERLDKTDATYVDIIHTDSYLGIQDAIGHKDYYPNGGASQAGCLIGKRETEMDMSEDEKGDLAVSFISCSHSRVTYLYAESIITTCKFGGTPCASYDDYNAGRCSCPAAGCPSLGHNSINVNLSGKFYLKTTGNSPYCIQ